MIRTSKLAITLLAGLLALACTMWPGKAQANVVCSLTSQTVSFGTSSAATGSIGYSCINYNATTTSFTICSRLGSPSYPGTTAQPAMLNGANQLNFNLYTNAARTQLWVGTTAITGAVSIAAGATITGSLSFYGSIPTGQSAPAGSYTGYFYATSLGMVQSGSCQEHIASVFDGTNNTLTATASVSNNCTVSTISTLNLGTVSATATNTAASTGISITCPSGTAYYVGLAPSNGSTTGAGILSGTGSNTDKPPYQLRSVSSSGPVWGNTATSTSVGNGVAGTGNASVQSITVFAVLPSANYRPDSYSDTITVNLNF